MFLYLLNIHLPFLFVEIAVVRGGLSVFLKFLLPLYCGVSSLQVGLHEWLVKLSWLGELVLVFWWVEMSLFSLECPAVSFKVSVGLVWYLAACVLILRVMSLCWWRISLVCLAMNLVGSLVELGFNVGVEAFG